MALGLAQPQKLEHEERIVQIHIKKPPVHSGTKVEL